jgi:hypothetical protein
MGRRTIFLALLVTGCATPYQDMGFAGGVAAYPMTAETYRIEARGNGYTSSTTVNDYVMLKAAETTKAAGGTHFVLISDADASTTGSVVLPGQAQTSFVGHAAYTTYTPPTSINIHKPGENTYIRILTIAPGQAPPPGAISADEIIQFVGKRVKRG